MRLTVPFLYKAFGKEVIVEKTIDAVFTIATLEVASIEVLKCEDLWEVSERNIEDINIAILYAGYIQACKNAYTKPKYTLKDAEYWINHLSKDSAIDFYKAVGELMGSMKKKEGGEKKK